MHDASDPEQDLPPLPEELVDGLHASPPDDDARRRWLAQHPERAGEVSDAQEIWRLSEPPLDAGAWPEMLQRIERAEARERRMTIMPAPQATSLQWPALARTAAVLAIGVALGQIGPRFFRRAPAPVGRTAVTVPAGAMAVLRLSGGIVAHLNAVSTLSYAAAGPVSEVELEGEAYFEVPHDSSRQFTVRTSAGVVRDLGTAFDVRARDRAVRVAVTEGVVRLEAARHAVTVPAGQQSSAADGQPPLPPFATDVQAARGWLDGTLVFIDAPLGEVAAELARHFGVPFRVSSALAARHITATIRTRRSADAARAICAAIAARCEPADGGWAMSSKP